MKKKIFFLSIVIVIVAETIFAGVQLSKLSTAKRCQEHISLGDKYYDALDYENAELCYLQAIEIDEKNVVPYIQLSEIYTKTERYEEAYTILMKAQEVVPESDMDSNNLLETLISGLNTAQSEGENNQLEESEQKEYVTSSWLMQSYKGNIYTMKHEVQQMSEDSGFIQFEGDSEGAFAVHKDHIYYTKYFNDQFVMYRCDLDGTNTEVFVDNPGWDIGSLSFYFYEDSLFYTANVGNPENYDEFDFQNRRLDLNTRQSEDIQYSVVDGNEYIWLVHEDGTNVYDIKYCKPYFKEIQTLPEYDDSYSVFVYEKDIYYSRDGQIYCYSTETQEEALWNKNEEVSDRTRFYLENNGLYYYKKGDSAIYRYDLLDETEQRYEIDLLEEMYWCVVEYEVDGKVYISSYRDIDMEEEQLYYEQYGRTMFNMDLWELDLETGTHRHVGGWYSP